MASISGVGLTITPLPGSRNVAINVRYQLVGDEVDVARQTPYREVCQLIGDDKPGGTDIVLVTIRDRVTFFPEDPVTSSRFLDRSLDLVLSLTTLDEDKDKPFLEEDEIRAKVTLALAAPNFLESNLVRIGGPVVIGQVVPPIEDRASTGVS
jgi:hypothetical protein